MSDGKFKVIIVGGGPVGLTAAHALSQAGINYVLLESRDSCVIDVGASLGLWPQALRVLAQFGLLERLRAVGAELKRGVYRTYDGRQFHEVQMSPLEKNHGISQILFQRSKLLEVLYESLGEADKARIHTNKKVTNIITNEHGVEVKCADDSTYYGSIVIGADGVHSKTRSFMRDLALKASSTKVNEERPYTCEYKALWASYPRLEGLVSGDTLETHGSQASVQSLNGNDMCWLFLYEKLPKPTNERASYSEADVEAYFKRHAELPITENIKVKDVYKHKFKAGMTNLEEGILKHWSWNRIVLVGDACHKFTPNQGLGYNNGLQDVAALVNELHGLVAKDASPPSIDAITGAFTRYQAVRSTWIKKDYESSAQWTRMSAWPGLFYRLLDRYIMPSIPFFNSYLLNSVLSDKVSNCPSLQYLETGEPFKGKVPWKNPIRAPVKLAS
ncbi:hypothetical protein M426DRAFT_16488 [Hypoxylon sp. CI-4A]|nr:hypothetical protein M426DRAFT_16488 [Hypoxylon sp. CI-4A]